MADNVFIDDAMASMLRQMVTTISQIKIQLADLELTYVVEKGRTIRAIDDAQTSYNNMIRQLAQQLGLGEKGKNWRFDPVQMAFIAEE